MKYTTAVSTESPLGYELIDDVHDRGCRGTGNESADARVNNIIIITGSSNYGIIISRNVYIYTHGKSCYETLVLPSARTGYIRVVRALCPYINYNT